MKHPEINASCSSGHSFKSVIKSCQKRSNQSPSSLRLVASFMLEKTTRLHAVQVCFYLSLDRRENPSFGENSDRSWWRKERTSGVRSLSNHRTCDLTEEEKKKKSETKSNWPFSLFSSTVRQRENEMRLAHGNHLLLLQTSRNSTAILKECSTTPVKERCSASREKWTCADVSLSDAAKSRSSERTKDDANPDEYRRPMDLFRTKKKTRVHRMRSWKKTKRNCYCLHRGFLPSLGLLRLRETKRL